MFKKLYSTILLALTILYSGYSKGTTYAVIIGVSNYKNFSILNGDLRYSSRDAVLFYNYMVSPTGGDIPVNQTIVLTNEQASKNAILSALTLFEKATEADRIIFFFSGHGNKGKFLPYDTDGRSPMITYKEIKQAFRKSKAGSKICIADACFAGSIEKNAFESTSPSDTTNSFRTEKNVLVFLACLSNQKSVEYGSLKQGVFTYYLLKGFLGEADENQDKVITAFEIYQYVSKNVKMYTKKTIPNERPQTPMMYGRFPKELPIIQINK